jgi:hypothetical protein
MLIYSKSPINPFIVSISRFPRIRIQVGEMWWINIITACTNLVAILAIELAEKYADSTTASCIKLAAAFSFVSHLAESHKHGLYGFGTQPEISYLLNRLDVFFASVLFARICYLAYHMGWERLAEIPMDIYLLSLMCFLCNVISEWDKTADTQFRFFLFHNLWHIGIFIQLERFLEYVYVYKP